MGCTSSSGQKDEGDNKEQPIRVESVTFYRCEFSKFIIYYC